MTPAGQLVAAACVLAALIQGSTGQQCPGSIAVQGHGAVELVTTGWGNPPVNVWSPGGLTVWYNARSYFAQACTVGRYDHNQYVALQLLGKTLKYTVDLAGANCGCNVAFYLSSMPQNTQPGQSDDFYCDANCGTGPCCAEIDIQEANQFAWHSTLHTASDKYGADAGYGGGGSDWSGPRAWSSAQYGPGGQCVDTSRPFEVSVSFPVDGSGTLTSMQVKLSQQGKRCTLSTSVDGYYGNGQLTAALRAGMTPVVSYWSSPGMLWLDGRGSDGQGACAADNQQCGQKVRFWGFSVEPMGGGYVPARPTPAVPHPPLRGACPAGQLKLSGKYCAGTLWECNCNYCDDCRQQNACTNTCRVLNGIYRCGSWTAKNFRPTPDCRWMAGTGQGGIGDDCRQCFDTTMICRRENPDGNCRVY